MPVAWTRNSLTKFFEIRGDYIQRKCALATNANVKRGDFLVMTSGAVDQAVSLPGSNNSASSATSTAIYGIALEDKNEANGDTHVQVALANNALEIALRLYNSTAGDAEIADISLLTNYQYVRYRGADSGSWWYMASTGVSSTPPLEFIEKHLGNIDADDYGIGWFKMLHAVVQEGV